MNNISYKFVLEAIEILEAFEFNHDFVLNEMKIEHSDCLVFNFTIKNIAYKLKYELERHGGWEPEWCSWIWNQKINVKLHFGIREALGVNFYVEEFGINAEKDRAALWNKHNSFFKELFDKIVKIKKKINYDQIHELLAVPNLLRAKSFPEHIDKNQFEIIKFNSYMNETFYKLDDAEFALVLLAKTA